MITDGGEIIIEKKPFQAGKPLVIILIIICVFVAFLGIGLAILVFSPRTVDQQVVINPHPSPDTSAVKIISPKFAADSSYLRLKSDLDTFAYELNQIDLAEPHLAPPKIDLNISIPVE